MKFSEITKEKRVETLSLLALAIIVISLMKSEASILDDTNKIKFIAAILLSIGLFITSLAKIITFGWMKLAEILGLFMPKVVLGLFFYLFLFPFTLIFRLFNKDNLNIVEGKSTYFSERNHKYSARDLENIW